MNIFEILVLSYWIGFEFLLLFLASYYTVCFVFDFIDYVKNNTKND